MDAPSQYICFNPYFSGCFSLRYIAGLKEPGAMDGFNPYFSGCFSLSIQITNLYCAVRILFQSLFFWMLLSKVRVEQRRPIQHRFQSLFFWMLLSKSAFPQPGKSGKVGFNPYFSGCFSLRFPRWTLYRLSLLWVSILIFLDASL